MTVFKRHPSSTSSESSSSASQSRWRFNQLFKHSEHIPPVSEQMLHDVFFYGIWCIAPIQQTPIFLGLVALLMGVSWLNRIQQGNLTQFTELFPDEGRWLPIVLLAGLFLLSSVIWTPNRYDTLMAWLYGFWTPFLILMMQYHFIQNLNHWRKALTFFLAYLIFIFTASMMSRQISLPVTMDRYNWPAYFFTSQATASWLLIIYPLFLGLVWHQNKQYHRFSAIGIAVVFLVGMLIGKLGLWLGLWGCTAAMLGSFAWVGKCHYKFSDFKYTHRSGFKVGLIILGILSFLCVYGIFKNHGAEWLVSWKVSKSMPVPEMQPFISGQGLGEGTVRIVFHNIKGFMHLPWLVSLFYQVGILGVILAVWLWLTICVGFVADLYASRPDRQWIGVLGIGVMISLFESSFFSNIELGTLMVPASLAIATLLGLKRYLNTLKL